MVAIVAISTSVEGFSAFTASVDFPVSNLDRKAEFIFIHLFVISFQFLREFYSICDKGQIYSVIKLRMISIALD